jgi:hypothetical protein
MDVDCPLSMEGVQCMYCTTVKWQLNEQEITLIAYIENDADQAAVHGRILIFKETF